MMTMTMMMMVRVQIKSRNEDSFRNRETGEKRGKQKIIQVVSRT